MEFFLNGAELLLNSVNSEKMINHPNMNWAQFKDPISHMCHMCWHCGSMLVSYTRGGRVAGSSPFNVINFCHWIQPIQWKSFRKNSNSPFKDSYSHPFHVSFAMIGSNDQGYYYYYLTNLTNLDFNFKAEKLDF